MLDLGLPNKDPQMKLHWLMHSVSGPIALKPFFFHFHPFCQCVLGALLIYVKQLKACGLGKVRRAGKDKDNTRVRTPFSSCSFLVNLRLLTAAIGCPGGYNHTCLSLPSLIFFFHRSSCDLCKELYAYFMCYQRCPLYTIASVEYFCSG